MSARIAVFVSGGGSNLQALLERFRDSSDIEVALVIADRADAGGLTRARDAGVDAHVVPVRGEPSAELAARTMQLLTDARIDVIALAGYLRLIPAQVVRAYRGRILNIHPALLPAFGGPGMYGRKVHQAVLDAGVCVTGVTVHFVDERYDEGRPLVQWPVPVLRDDTPESLAARVLRAEHVVYPLAIEWLVRGERTAPCADPIQFTMKKGAAPATDDVRRLLAGAVRE